MSFSFKRAALTALLIGFAVPAHAQMRVDTGLANARPNAIETVAFRRFMGGGGHFAGHGGGFYHGGMRPGAHGHGIYHGGYAYHGGYGYRGGGWRYGGYGYGYPVAAGVAGLATGAVIGGALASQAQPAYVGNDAAAYCAGRYRSYDPASGTFLGNDGLRHPCP